MKKSVTGEGKGVKRFDWRSHAFRMLSNFITGII